jgi:hypothetical protein
MSCRTRQQPAQPGTLRRRTQHGGPTCHKRAGLPELGYRRTGGRSQVPRLGLQGGRGAIALAAIQARRCARNKASLPEDPRCATCWAQPLRLGLVWAARRRLWRLAGPRGAAVAAEDTLQCRGCAVETQGLAQHLGGGCKCGGVGGPSVEGWAGRGLRGMGEPSSKLTKSAVPTTPIPSPPKLDSACPPYPQDRTLPPYTRTRPPTSASLSSRPRVVASSRRACWVGGDSPNTDAIQ